MNTNMCVRDIGYAGSQVCLWSVKSLVTPLHDYDINFMVDTATEMKAGLERGEVNWCSLWKAELVLACLNC